MLSNSHIRALSRATKRVCRIIATTPLCAMLAYFCLHMAGVCSLQSCRIEPPLLLPDQLPYIRLALGDVVTDLNIVWNIDTDWRKYWWYGWNDEDIKLFGDIAYPEPTNFEGRFYFFGEEISTTGWLNIERQTIYETPFRRRFEFGFHNMLIWSNVETADGTQTLYIDEDDPDNITATTSRSRLSYTVPSRSTEVYNNPEIFYSGSADNIYISRDTTDYDYYDPVRDAWIKEIPADLYPMVYIYLVQVAIYNNRGRVKGVTDNAAISSMADGVKVYTGQTSANPVLVSFPMRMKLSLPARDNREADIIGGKLTTFGLCDMVSWARSRDGNQYAGGRPDLRNHLMLNFAFYNSFDSAYAFDITEQLQRQVHGGIVTVEIDADTLDMPGSKNLAGGFDPTIENLDSITHEFPM